MDRSPDTRSRALSSASSTGSSRSRFFLPLSNHGLPKPPKSPGSVRSHRFSGVLRSPPMSPRSFAASPPLSPVSTPLSAKSFGTFIESAPTTPACSPRAPSSNWDRKSPLIILSPVSSVPLDSPEALWGRLDTIPKDEERSLSSKASSPVLSTPTSPREPVWDMMRPSLEVERPFTQPRKISPPSPMLLAAELSPHYIPPSELSPRYIPPGELSPRFIPPSELSPNDIPTDISPHCSLTSHPVRHARHHSDPRQDHLPSPRHVRHRSVPRDEDLPTPEVTVEEAEAGKEQEEKHEHVAPLEKLASKMRSMLRRKPTGTKSAEKRLATENLDRIEDVHWTEM